MVELCILVINTANMPTSQTKLIDAFGEMIYAVAMADGAVQREEIDAIHRVLRKHPWAKEIEWSFNYENLKHHTAEEAYEKAIYFMQEYGPTEEYNNLLDVLQEVAKAYAGIVPGESDMITRFRDDLVHRFTEDMEKYQLKKG